MSSKISNPFIKFAGIALCLFFIFSGTIIAGPGAKHGGDEQLKVYPQPGNETINVGFMVETPRTVVLRVYSMSGELVTEQAVICEYPGWQTAVLDIRGMAQGPYILLDHDGSRREAGQIIIIGP